jgi:ribosomal-protein-alanine N-acetyltransferase
VLTFTPFPSLETPRLVLRELVPADVEAVFRMQSDPEVTRYFGRDPDRTPADTEKRLTLVFDGVRDVTAIRWGITFRGSSELLGTVGFWRWNKPHQWAETGYELAAAHWGKGVMTEALGAALGFAFGVMELHRVEAQLDPANRGSSRVLEKLGFAREALLRENWFYDGKFTDTAIYGLLARDFQARASA